jgi:hypothetical protein
MNLLKRPATSTNLLKKPATLEGVSSMRKRARVAKDEDATQEKTVMLPMSMVIKEVYPPLGLVHSRELAKLYSDLEQ